MRVAVAITTELFERADRQAAALGLNRSQLYARALEEFLLARRQDTATSRSDELAVQAHASIGTAAARRLLDAGAWEW